MLRTHKRKKLHYQDHKSSKLHSALCNMAQNIFRIHTFSKKRVVSNHGSSTEATCGFDRVSRIFSGLISIFIFNILQIPCVSNHIFTGCTAYTNYWPDCTHILVQAINSADIWASVYPIKRLHLSHNCNHHIDVRQTSSLAAIEDCRGFTQ